MFQIEPLNDALLDGLPDFNRRAWRFVDRKDFLHWFFRDSPRTLILVAHDQGRWLSVLGIFVRSYLIDGEMIDCGESYAWATADDCRGLGIGIKIIKMMIERGQPLVALGGSADTMNFMPRVGYQTLAWAPALNLLLSPSAVGGEAGMAGWTGAKATLAKLGLTLLAPVLRPSAPAAASLRNVPITLLNEETLSMPSLPGFQATYDPDFFGWLMQVPVRVGTFLPFCFKREDALVGWAFARASEEAPGQIVGRILEFKFAPGTTPADHRAMALAVSAALAGLGAVIIRALTTCEDTNRALRSLRFISRISLPLMVHPAGGAVPHGPYRSSMIRADGALLPVADN
jgi:hypothetical protein